MQATSAEDCLLQQAGMRRVLQSRLLQQDATPIWCAALEADKGQSAGMSNEVSGGMPRETPSH